MSLDVYLEVDNPIGNFISGSKIFVREDGRIKEIGRAEWDERNPGREPFVTTEQEEETTTVYSGNITGNLSTMAKKAGIYEHLWRPDEIGIDTASQLIEPLQSGLNALISNPEYYQMFSPENGWGTYDGLIQFVAGYLSACKEHPDARVRVWR